MATRRSLIKTLGVISGASLANASAKASTRSAITVDNIRDQFKIDYSWHSFAGFLLASHPLVVEQAVQRHRAGLNNNPAKYLFENGALEQTAREAAGRYLGIQANQVALTDSTTMGIATLYNGITIGPGQEVVTTEHEHQSSRNSLAYRAKRDGLKVHTIRLYDEAVDYNIDTALTRLRAAITAKTRVLALTWVHSGSSVKLDITAVGKLVAELNRDRSEQNKILYCIDGVHGLGIENLSFDAMGCDFFVAGTHKWLFGPRGTGIICARNPASINITPTIPTFSPGDSFGSEMTPGGFHSYEHRWALGEAFDFHLQLGKAEVEARIHSLNTSLKTRLQDVPRVSLATPLSVNDSAGFTFFRVEDKTPQQVAEHLYQHKIIVSPANRDVGPVVRMAPGLLNTVDEIDAAIEQLRKFVKT